MIDDPNVEPGSPPTGSSPDVSADASSLSPPPAVPPPRPFVQRIFMGPDGIRSGWRALIFLAIAAVCIFAIGGLLSPLLHHYVEGLRHSFQPAGLLLGEGVPLVGVLIAALVMSKIEGRSFADFGLSFRHVAGGKFWIGMFWGWLALTALLVAVRLLHGFSFGSLALHGSALVRYAMFWAVAFLVVGLFEEFAFRGYLLSTLTQGMGFWPAAILLSCIFGGGHLHNIGEDWVGALSAGLIGLFFCFTLRRLGTLWYAVGFHAAWDYSESFIYSVPDSGTVAKGHLINSSFHGPTWLTGGSVGPEASVFVFAVIIVAFIAFGWAHRSVEFPLRRE
jgi:CAAX protease family protein